MKCYPRKVSHRIKKIYTVLFYNVNDFKITLISVAQV